VIPDSYRFAILFGAWLRPEELPRGAQMELRWDVARDYLSACDRRGSRPSVWGAYDFLHGRGRWRYDQKTSPKAGAP
jgi:hypothetical protein